MDVSPRKSFSLGYIAVIALMMAAGPKNTFGIGARKGTVAPPVASETSDEEEDEEEADGEQPVVVKSGTSRQPQSVAIPSKTVPPPKVAVAPAPSKEEEEEEEEEEEASKSSAKSVENPNAKKKMIEKLVEKLKLPNKKLAHIVFLRPVNYLQPELTDVVLTTMQKVLARYGEFNIAIKDQKLPSLTLEGFRGIMGKIKADVVFTTVMKATHFDLFIFDRRTPYYVFYHTEVHPEEVANSGKISEELAIEQTRVLVRRGLYLYLTNQFYELPRENREVVMEAQIPRWMASSEMVESVNHMMGRRFYVAASMGGAVSSTSDSRTWAGGVFGLQVGGRVLGNISVEGSYQAFAYNAFLGSLRYNISNKYSGLQMMPGIGVGYLTDRKTIDADHNLTLHRDYYYMVPSFSIWLPLGDLYFKAETQLQVSLSADKVVLHFMPGLLYQF